MFNLEKTVCQREFHILDINGKEKVKCTYEDLWS